MRVLIVDDEQKTRESLQWLISWEKLGVDEVLLAIDGEDALEKAKMGIPDLLLTDVRMPVMDGIELAHSFIELYPLCKILFLSGYSDKDYLMSAIKLQVSSYIEKPIDPVEVEAALSKAIQEISEERRYHQRETERISALQEEFVRSLLSSSLAQAERSARQAGIEYADEHWHGASAYTGNSEENALLRYLAENRIQKHYFCQVDGFIHLLAIGEDARPEVILRQSATATGNMLFIGISGAFGGLDKAAVVLAEAFRAAQDSFFFSKPQTIYLNTNTCEAIPPSAMFPNPLGRPAEMEAMISACCVQMTDTPGITASVAREWLYRLASALIDDAQQYRISSDPLPSKLHQLWDWINGFPTMATAAEALTAAVYSLAALAERRSHVAAAIRYIEQNLGDYNLSQSAIAEHLRLNPSYLCTLFKEDTGETMVQFITRKRMEMAKILLFERNASVRNVAGKVGYVDIAWFVKRFKQTFQMTPSEYREKYVK